jgi:hypothetical protein
MALSAVEVAVMVAVPPPVAVTVPPETVATAVSLLDQVMPGWVVLPGARTGLSVPVAPLFNARDAGFRLIPWMGTAAATTDTVTVSPGPSALVAVMSAVPTVYPVTRPVALTLAIAGAEESQATVLSVASAGLSVAVNWMVFPGSTEGVVGLITSPVTRTSPFPLAVFSQAPSRARAQNNAIPE